MPSLSSSIDHELLKQILSQSLHAMAIYISAELEVGFINSAMLSIWDKDISVMGIRFEDALPEMEGQPFTSQLKNVWQTGETFHATNTPAEIEVDGNRRVSYFDFIFQPIKDSSGRVLCVLNTAINVTERVKAWGLAGEKKLEHQRLNEALQALNEEYQAKNEDLAAVNEEYQATNEELNKLNDQYKALYENLSHTERRMQEVIRTTPIGIALLRGEEMTIETANPEMLRIWGEKEGVVIGKSLLEVFPGLKSQSFEKLLQLCYITASPVNLKQVQYYLQNAGEQSTGSFLNLDFYPLLHSDGAVDAIMATATDVTQEVQIRDKIVQNESRLKKINEKLTVINEEFQSTNEELAKLNEEFIATNEQLEKAYQLIDELNQDLLVSNQGLKDSNEQFRLANEKLDHSNSDITGHNHELRRSNERVNVLNQKLQENEQHLQGILDTMAEGVGITDEKGKLIYANPRAQTILGLSQNDILERTYDDPKWHNTRVDGSPLPPEEHPMAIMMRSGKPVYDHEIGIHPPGSSPFYISINAAPIFNNDGILSGGIGTFMDVTARRMILQGQDDFISIASHELKTPVTALKASLQLLERSHLNLSQETRGKLIAQSVKSLANLSKLISDLLDTARVEKGQLKIHLQQFSLDSMIDDCMNSLTTDIQQKIVKDVQADIFLNADNHQLCQVLVNFITNAAKYAPDSEKIVLSAALQHENLVKISVKDFGNGIEKEKLPQLFERYYRTSYQGQKFTGLGLGLYISSEIIKAHHGNIGVESALGVGSTFWFTLPISNSKE